MNKLAIATVALCFTAIGGCGHMGAELAGFHDGWRRAIVKGDGTSAALASTDAVEDCRSAFGVDATRMRFALTSYTYGGSATLTKERIVVVPEGLAVHSGDHVAINVLDGRLPLKTLASKP